MIVIYRFTKKYTFVFILTIEGYITVMYIIYNLLNKKKNKKFKCI